MGFSLRMLLCLSMMKWTKRPHHDRLQDFYPWEDVARVTLIASNDMPPEVINCT